MPANDRRDVDSLVARVMAAWESYGESGGGGPSGGGGARFVKLTAIWEKLHDIARDTIASGGDNANDEGKKSGALKRAWSSAEREEAAAAAAALAEEARLTAAEERGREGDEERALTPLHVAPRSPSRRAQRRTQQQRGGGGCLDLPLDLLLARRLCAFIICD